MVGAKLSHIAIAVRDIEKSKRLYLLLTGATAGEIIELSEHFVKVCLIDTGAAKIELISPLPGNKGLTNFLEKKGDGLHHISFGVANIQEALSALKAKGFRLIDEKPRVGAEGHKIAFMHPESTGGVLIELEETPENLT